MNENNSTGNTGNDELWDAGMASAREYVDWHTELAALTAYAAENGHTDVPSKFISPDGHRTGAWIAEQRRKYAAGELTPDRIAKLQQLPGRHLRRPAD